MVRLGVNRLINGDGETAEGWQGPAVAYHTLGRESSRSLKVGQEFVGQEVSGFLGTHATWVLEFFYRSLDDTKHPDLLAGLMTESDEPDSVVQSCISRPTSRLAIRPSGYQETAATAANWRSAFLWRRGATC